MNRKSSSWALSSRWARVKIKNFLKTKNKIGEIKSCLLTTFWTSVLFTNYIIVIYRTDVELNMDMFWCDFMAGWVGGKIYLE